MNNKLIKENLVQGIHCFIYLLIGVLLESCGSDNTKNELAGSGDNIANQYLLLEQNGLNKITVTGNEKEYRFVLTVKKIGGKIDFEFGVKLETWTEEQLAIYNERQKTSYKLLPLSNCSKLILYV